MILVVVLVLLIWYIYLGAKKPQFAIITCPIAVMVPIIYITVVTRVDSAADAAAIAFAILIFPATFISILVKSTSDEIDRERWPRTCAKCIFIATGVIGLLAVSIFVWPMALVLLPIFAVVFTHSIVISRNSRVLYVVSTIGASMRQNLPLAMALETAAGRSQNKRSKILRRISGWLVQGYSLSEAIRRGFSKCPADVLATIIAAEKMDQLPQALKSLEANMVEKADESRRVRPVSWSYPLIVLTAVFLVVMGLCIFIVPIFAEVLSDVSEGTIPLPAPTQFLLNFSDLMRRNYGLVPVLSWLVILVIWSVSAYTRFRGRRPERPRLISRIADFAKWHFPFVRWFEENYSLLRVVSVLKVALNTGCSVDKAISNTLDLDTNYCFRKRLARWFKKVDSGENISTAARDSRVGNAIAWAFDAEINKGNTPEILEMLEEFYRSNYSYKANIAKSIITPCMVIMLGATVGFVVYAIYIPMVTMTVYFTDVVP